MAPYDINQMLISDGFMTKQLVEGAKEDPM